MRNTVLILLISALQVFATGSYAQTKKISLAMKDAAIRDVLYAIQKQSEFYFLYNSELIDVTKKVDITIEEEKVDQVLTRLFNKNEVDFLIKDRYIVLTPVGGNAELFAEQQQPAVSGKVTDESGQPLPGVTIVIKGTTRGTATNADGEFSISSLPDDATLVFSFVGMRTQEVVVGSQTNISIRMVEETIGIEEVVAVGYGTMKKSDLTGAISTVTSASLAKETSANAVQRLQGKASGVTVINSHVPGEGAIINIRGLSTINNNSPLYVVDGVPTKSISRINPNEIESLTVLKDASSTAIYGARAANGVIIITTNRGSSKEKITVSTRYGISSSARLYDLANTQEIAELKWLEFKNEGIPPVDLVFGNSETPIIPDYLIPVGKMEGDPLVNPELYNYTSGSDFYNITKLSKEGTNWGDVILRNAIMNEQNIMASGSGDKGAYAFNIGHLKEEGILKYTSYEHYSIRSNIDLNINSWLKIGESVGINHSIDRGNKGSNYEGSPLWYTIALAPYVPVYDIMGNFAGSKGTNTGNENPLALLFRDRDDFNKNLRIIGNTYAEIQLIKSLNFKSLFGIDYSNSNARNIARMNPEYTLSISESQLAMANSNGLQWNWANTLQYKKRIGDLHNLYVLLGTEAVSSNSFNINASRTGFASEDVLFMVLNAGEKNQTNSGSMGESSSLSYFGRMSYDYMSKYLFDFTFRRDGSSKFGMNKRWGNFPAGSIGWRISEESFMTGIKNWGIDYIKIRGGYGLSGNDEVGGLYNAYTTYSSNVSASYYAITGSTSSSSAGFMAAGLGNPNAKWETTSTINVGVDIACFNQLDASIDIWQRNTIDMLYRVAIPAVVGGVSAPSVNIGKMKNKGVDLSINYRNKAIEGNFIYDLGLIISHYKNEIKKISNKENEFIGGPAYREMQYTRASEGTSFPEFYGLIVDGYFKDNDDAHSYPPSFDTYNLPGHFKFRNVNDDDVIDNDDRTYIGNPHPKFTAGLNMNIDYKAFSISAFLYSSYGNKLVNYVSRWIDYGYAPGMSKKRLYKSWGSPYLLDNSKALLPLADYSSISMFPSTAFIEDGSYLRLKTLQLGYALSKKVNQMLKINGLQIYVQANNLFTITKYNGLDPEISSSGMSLGIDSGGWPAVRQMLFGISFDL